MAALSQLGGETWFNLGDRDLAMHIERSRRLANGEPLSHVTAALAAALAGKVPVDENTVIMLTGGNADPAAFARTIASTD